MKKEKTIFLTGATGFVGSNLAYKFLRKGYNLKFLVRDKNEDSKKRTDIVMLKICDNAGQYRMWQNKIEVLRGDISKDNLGLSPDDLSRLSADIDIVFHCAANTSFDQEKRAEIEKDNVLGTKNILEFTKRVENPNLHYMSTAYVCGQRKGVIYENELDNNQIFNNPYEESKFKAEKLVRTYGEQHNIKIIIYRPAIIVGNSITGKTVNFLGFYSLIKAMHLLSAIFREDLKRDGKRSKLIGAYCKGNILYIPLRVLGISNKTFNIVPIDYVVEVISEVFKKEDNYNKTYHITNPSPPTLGHIKRLICDYFNMRGPKIVDPLEFQANPMNQYEEFFAKSIRNFSPYLQKEEAIFSDTNTQEALNGTNIKFPYVTKNLVSKLIFYCLESNWGRK